MKFLPGEEFLPGWEPLDYGKKILQYVGPVSWGCFSNNTKMLPLHMFSYRVKSRVLAGH